MSRVIFFEFPADDPKRAIAFYEKVFGWTITKWEGPFDYWLITTGPDDEPGINGAIMPRRMPEQVTVDTMSVESVDDFTKKIRNRWNRYDSKTGHSWAGVSRLLHGHRGKRIRRHADGSVGEIVAAGRAPP